MHNGPSIGGGRGDVAEGLDGSEGASDGRAHGKGGKDKGRELHLRDLRGSLSWERLVS